MKLKNKIAVLLLIGACSLACQGRAGGIWTTLPNMPVGNFGHMLLLTDGTVISENGSPSFTTGPGWSRLTPGSNGSYTNGTWTTNALMIFTHEDFASQVLQNGKLMVAGGEYGTGGATTEIYDPVSNIWTQVTVPAGLLNTTAPAIGISDANSILLANGTMMVSPVYPATNNQTIIYDPVANTWTNGPATLNSQDEGSWMKLPDDSILTVDSGSTNSERYIPSLKKWIVDANLPVSLYDPFGTELGPGMLLPNGKAIYFGATGKTAIYTPSGTTNLGSWVAGPNFPNGQGMPDAPAAMMSNGRILCATAPIPTAGTEFGSPVSFYEYDYVSNNFTQVSSPTGGSTFAGQCWPTLMLDLPDGSVLFASRSANLYVYTPTNGAPLAAGKPTVQSVSLNGDGSLHLTGTLFNGISAGAAYGDDEQEDSNYPIVRFTAADGTVRYGRSYNWSSTGVATGSQILSTECTMPAGATLQDSIQVIANGNASDGVHYPLYSGITWVDFNYFGGGYNGAFSTPYNTIATGVSGAAQGGIISIKAGSSSSTIRIAKPLRIVASGGVARIGP